MSKYKKQLVLITQVLSLRETAGSHRFGNITFKHVRSPVSILLLDDTTVNVDEPFLRRWWIKSESLFATKGFHHCNFRWGRLLGRISKLSENKPFQICQRTKCTFPLFLLDERLSGSDVTYHHWLRVRTWFIKKKIDLFIIFFLYPIISLQTYYFSEVLEQIEHHTVQYPSSQFDSSELETLRKVSRELTLLHRMLLPQKKVVTVLMSERFIEEFEDNEDLLQLIYNLEYNVNRVSEFLDTYIELAAHLQHTHQQLVEERRSRNTCRNRLNWGWV